MEGGNKVGRGRERKRKYTFKTNTSLFPAAAAATKSLQSCPTLCDPIDGSP